MGEVSAISLLIPGAEVSVSDHVVCVQMAGTCKCYDALEIKELPGTAVKMRQFAPLVSVPSNAPHPVVLVRCDMQFVGDFTPRALRLLKQGAHYVITLQGGLPIPGKDEEAELRCDMAHVLKESSDGAVLLGVVSVDLEE